MSNSSLLILMPVFNDWAACDCLLVAVDAVLARNGLSAAVLLVDDGSTDPIPRQFAEHEYRAFSRVDVLRLRRNLGHQRAICAGLCYVDCHSDPSCEAVVLMDSDGRTIPATSHRFLKNIEKRAGRKSCSPSERNVPNRSFFAFAMRCFACSTGF